jgi:hypothetical protein
VADGDLIMVRQWSGDGSVMVWCCLGLSSSAWWGCDDGEEVAN